MKKSEDIFDEFAGKYEQTVDSSIAISGDSVLDFALIKARLVSDSVGSEVGLKLLDFGCGTGTSTRALTDAMPALAAVTGIDPSIESIDRANAENTARNVNFLIQPSERLPFADESYDIVFTSCVFHHIERSDHAKWLGEIRRVLKRGGKFFLFEHNPLNPMTQRAVRECPFDEGVILLSSRYSQRVLRAAGFNPERTRFYYFFPRMLSPLRRLEPMLQRVPLGAQYYVLARR
jgi:ubiquinone/menaquinone biosynthesis C-methylase UbiE